VAKIVSNLGKMRKNPNFLQETSGYVFVANLIYSKTENCKISVAWEGGNYKAQKKYHGKNVVGRTKMRTKNVPQKYIKITNI